MRFPAQQRPPPEQNQGCEETEIRYDPAGQPVAVQQHGPKHADQEWIQRQEVGIRISKRAPMVPVLCDTDVPTRIESKPTPGPPAGVPQRVTVRQQYSTRSARVEKGVPGLRQD